METNNSIILEEPHILTADVRSWVPNATAHKRRQSEQYVLKTVELYLKSLGFYIVPESSTTKRRIADGEKDVVAEHIAAGVTVSFCYSETAWGASKTFIVWRNGQRLDITAIRKIAAALQPEE